MEGWRGEGVEVRGGGVRGWRGDGWRGEGGGMRGWRSEPDKNIISLQVHIQFTVSVNKLHTVIIPIKW